MTSLLHRVEDEGISHINILTTAWVRELPSLDLARHTTGHRRVPDRVGVDGGGRDRTVGDDREVDLDLTVSAW